MAFNAGSIIARLKLDSKQFNAEMAKSKAAMATTTASVLTLDKAMAALPNTAAALAKQFGRTYDPMTGKIDGVTAAQFRMNMAQRAVNDSQWATTKATKAANAQLAAQTAILEKQQRAAKFRQVAVGVAVAAVAIGALERAYIGAAKEGAKLVDQQVVFERFARAHRTTARQIISDTKAITRALSDAEIRRFGNMIDILGIGADRLPELTRIARSAGIALGQSTSYMLESLATGTARQSRLWLDNLGIIISVEEAQERYAKKLGITTKEMTDQQQRAAFLNAVLEKGDAIVAKVGAESETASDKVGKLTASWENFKNSFMQDIGESPQLFGISKLLDKATAYMEKYGAMNILLSGATGAGPMASHALGQAPSGAPFAKGAPTISDMNKAGFAAALARQKAAEAEEAAAAEWGNTFKQIRGLGIPGAFSTRGRAKTTGKGDMLDRGNVSTPDITFGNNIAEQAGIAIDAMAPLGDATASFFEMMVTNSDQAGRAFAANLLSGISSVMSRMGDMLIFSGIGMEALKALKGAQAIAAGLALKAISGLLRGGAVKNAPNISSSPRAFRNPITTDEDRNGPRVVIHVDNFVGSRSYARELMRTVDEALRANGQAEVFVNA